MAGQDQVEPSREALAALREVQRREPIVRKVAGQLRRYDHGDSFTRDLARALFGGGDNAASAG